MPKWQSAHNYEGTGFIEEDHDQSSQASFPAGLIVTAVRRGITLKQLFAEVLRERLRRRSEVAFDSDSTPSRMTSFEPLSDFSKKNCLIMGVIEEKFETLAPEDDYAMCFSALMPFWLRPECLNAAEAALRSTYRRAVFSAVPSEYYFGIRQSLHYRW